VSTYLIDTNILARLVVRSDPLRSVVKAAIRHLGQQAAAMRIASQNIIELWAVATRPVGANGLGLSTTRTAEEIDRIQSIFAMLDDPSGTFQRWRQLVQRHDVKGRQVYDARLAAIMIESGIEQILTFNIDDFRRFPGVTPISPSSLTTPSPDA